MWEKRKRKQKPKSRRQIQAIEKPKIKMHVASKAIQDEFGPTFHGLFDTIFLTHIYKIVKSKGKQPKRSCRNVRKKVGPNSVDSSITCRRHCIQNSLIPLPCRLGEKKCNVHVHVQYSSRRGKKGPKRVEKLTEKSPSELDRQEGEGGNMGQKKRTFSPKFMSFSKLVLVGESSISASSLLMDLSSTEGVGAGLGLLELQQLSSGGGVLWVPTSLVLLHTFFSATGESERD